MQGTIFKRVKHQCTEGKAQWVRLPNPLPKTFPCGSCGGKLTTEKETRYDCSWWAGGKKRSKTFSTKHAASRFLTSVVKETQEGTYQQTDRVSMSKVFNEWEEHLLMRRQQGLLKFSSLKSYRSILHKHLHPAFGAYRSDRFTVDAVLAWERRCASTLGEKGQTVQSYNHRLAVLRSVVAWARGPGQRYLAHDPLVGIKTLPTPKREPKFLEPPELDALLAAVTGVRDQTMFALLAYSGVRRGELFGLQWRDLDETSNRLHVQRAVYQGTVGRPKTKHSERWVDLPEPIVARLLVYKKEYPPIKKGFLFRSESGKDLNPDEWFIRVFQPTVQRAGLDTPASTENEEEEEEQTVGIHTLRHTYASLLAAQGENILYVKKQLGHASIAITANLYSHMFRETSVSAMERLSARIHK